MIAMFLLSWSLNNYSFVCTKWLLTLVGHAVVFQFLLGGIDYTIYSLSGVHVLGIDFVIL